MGTIILVAVSGEMTNRIGPAKDVCLSPLFHLCRQYAERLGQYWMVLLGNLPIIAGPDDVLLPGARGMSGMSASDLEAWSQVVFDWVGDNANRAADTVVLVGDDIYTHQVAQWLMLSGYTVNRPLEWLSERHQIDWLTGRLEELKEPLVA